MQHKANDALTHQRLCEVVELDQSTFQFYWKKDPHSPKMRRAGKLAGTSVNGYIQISIDDVKYKAHRLVWLYINKSWPDGDLDHINGNRTDNRIENLRVATCAQNGKNKCISSNNTSGYKGVSYCKKRNKYEARILHEGKRVSLGRFETADDANSAYIKASNEYYGQFARKAQ